MQCCLSMCVLCTCMQVEAVQCLLLLAEVHLAAQNPLGAFPYALSCMLHATSPAMQHDMLAAGKRPQRRPDDSKGGIMGS